MIIHSANWGSEKFCMKRFKFSDSQVLVVLKQAEVATAEPDLCRGLGISSGTAVRRSRGAALRSSSASP